MNLLVCYGRMLRPYCLIPCGAIVLGVLLATGGCSEPEPARIDPAGLDTLSFVGRQACTACHGEAMRAWSGSDHDLAMDVATPRSVLGDFGDASFTNCGVTTRFFRRNGDYVVRTTGPDGRLGNFTVSHTFGVRPLQQYLVTFPDGRLQALTIAWDVEDKHWFSLYPGECVAHDEWLHWTKQAMNWNYMCADCHSTGLQRNFQLATDSYETAFSEIDVSCEACHGPAELHLSWANGEEVPRTPGPYGLAVDLSRTAPPENEIDACAPCHSRRRPTYPGYVAGKQFLDHFEPAVLEEDLYYPDGQIDDEVYVYGSFVQSKMYANGVRCSDCHEPHSTRPKLAGNALCAQCHVSSVYNAPSHHHHTEGTEAASCVTCHMPARTYMVVDPRRDHSFRVPRPDLSVELDVPNACNGCHANQSAQWAADSIRAWYGDERGGTLQFATAFAGGRNSRPDAETSLRKILADPERPPIVRATAAHLLRTYETASAADAARAALQDPAPLVRTLAIRTVENLVSPEQATPIILPLVSDTSRLVRMEAARVVAGLAGERMERSPDRNLAFWEALSEYREGLLAVSEQPAAHLSLAVAHEGLGEFAAAEEAYLTALRLDTSFVPAHVNIAMLRNQQRIAALEAGSGSADSLFAATEASLRAAVRLQPGLAEAHYTLGLLLAERPERLPEASLHLDTAAELASDDARIQYNAGLAHQRLEDPRLAEKYLLAAYELEPAQPEYLNALGILYLQQERWTDALRFTRLLAERLPQSPAIQQRLTYIRERMDG